VNRKIHVQFRLKINENSLELEPEMSSLIELEESFVVSVTIPQDFRVLQIGNSREITFSIQQSNEVEYWITSDHGKICIKTEKPKDWQRFLSSNLLQMVGLISATLVSRKKEDFLWVQPSNDQKVWLLGIVWNNNNRYWEGMLVERNRQTDLDGSFWTIYPNEEKKYRKLYARQLFNSLTDKEGLGLPADFPFCSDRLILTKRRNQQLTIKVHPSELWFLLFHIDHFSRFQYGRFSLYKEVEWIITLKKSFIQNIYERSLIQSELQNIRNFLKLSVIILNTYDTDWEKNLDPDIKEKCQEGTDLLVKEILPLFQNIEVEDEVLSLRWYLNPTRDEISYEFLNHDTRYFFANFHAEGGRWQIGEGKKASWKNNPTPLHKSESDLWFSLSDLEKVALSHIRLMRIFHCHSLVLVDATHVHPSIAPLLLNMGALRVEGSIMEEDYLDYLCSLVHLFRQPQGLEFILMGKCLEKGIDFNNIMRRADDFLNSCNWEAISGI
jgi:hypothetical protein